MMLSPGAVRKYIYKMRLQDQSNTDLAVSFYCFRVKPVLF